MLIPTQLFAWDDGIVLTSPRAQSKVWRLLLETDSLEFSPLAGDLRRGQAFRINTIKQIRGCLTGGNAVDYNISKDPIIGMFRPVGCAVRKLYTSGEQWEQYSFGQSLRVLKNRLNVSVMNWSSLWKWQRLSRLVSWATTCPQRTSTSAAGWDQAQSEYALLWPSRYKSILQSGLGLIYFRYCLGIELSPSVKQDEDMRGLWDETNIIISTWVAEWMEFSLCIESNSGLSQLTKDQDKWHNFIEERDCKSARGLWVTQNSKLVGAGKE